MAEPDWAKILTILYREGNQMEAPHQLDSLSDDHVLVERSDLSPEKIESSLVFLRNQGLIEIPTHVEENNPELENGDSRKRIIELKPDGFDVAHQRELSLRENAGNYAVGALTFVLGLTAIVQAVIAYSAEDLNLLETGIIGGLLVLTAVVLVVTYNQLNRAGALDLNDLIERRNR